MTRKEFLKKLDDEKKRFKEELPIEQFLGFMAAECLVCAMLPEQFEEESCEFDWGTVKKNTIVKHRAHGYGLATGVAWNVNAKSGMQLGAEIQFESGLSKLFFGDQYREFTKIGAWTADIQD